MDRSVQLKEFQREVKILRKDLEALKISGEDLLERIPQMVDIRHRSNFLQETLDEIIQKQVEEIECLREEFIREKSRCLLAIDQLESKWEEQIQRLMQIVFH